MPLQKTGVTKLYEKMSGENSGITKLPGGGESIDLDGYVTDKSVDGLYHCIAEQKKEFQQIRLTKQ